MASAESKPFTGECACGSIKYKLELPADADVPKQNLCHCICCKRMSGACFTRTIIIPLSALTLTSGTPKKFTQKKENSGIWYFCPECGSHIYAEHPALGGKGALRVGTLDQQAEFTEVGMHLNCENESKWLKGALEQEARRFETFPTVL